ncbi:MAG TPA: inositol monophosphatase family protein [Candidatus Dojkabacteria bacterium]|nr:inositol monophosphatase family protein [Candidatus Dojkabacteria bacterium]
MKNAGLDYADLLKTISNLLITQGKILQSAFLHPESYRVLKKDFGKEYGNLDFVTNLDDTIESAIYINLKKKYPDLGFYLEEHPHLNDTNKEFVCFIDALDGTKWFINNVPLFSMLIGIVKNQEPVLGATYFPITNQIFLGAEGQPTTLNGKQVFVSKTRKVNNAIVSVEDSTHGRTWEKEKDWINNKIILLNNKCQRIRLLGSGGLSCAWAAAGFLDCYIDIFGHADKPFDITAGKALVKYAGGKVAELKIVGFASPRLIMGNYLIVEQISELLTQK